MFKHVLHDRIQLDVLKCQVKSFNERNPCLQLGYNYDVVVIISNELNSYTSLKILPWKKRRKEWMTTDHHERYAQGCKRVTIELTKGSNEGIHCESLNNFVNQDRRLQLAFVNLDLEVIVEECATVNRKIQQLLLAQHASRVNLIKG